MGLMGEKDRLVDRGGCREPLDEEVAKGLAELAGKRVPTRQTWGSICLP